MSLRKTFLLSLLMICSTGAFACKDNVVLVHGNTASPSSWQNTLAQLRARGYATSQIYTPDWGSKTCAACNNHSGWEETPVRSAIQTALANSCSGRIDVIGHSMGATLAALQIEKLGVFQQVDTFIGIAGAFRGLWSCGTYPFNVPSSTCGRYGLSVSSPFLDNLFGIPLADTVYSFKSNFDQVVCATGFCTIGGVHSSRIWNENASYTFPLGHFGLQTDTAAQQVSLLD